nr:hypothetical protein [Tanacetum cinerariifolium]
AELIFKAKALLLPLAGAEDRSYIMTPFKASALNVEFDFKINLIVFGPKTVSGPTNFSSRGRGVLETKDSFAESYSVAKELVTSTGGLVVFLYDSAG